MSSVLIVSNLDNVATALVPLTPGDRLRINDVELQVREAIPAGHKVALAGISAGAAVIKYGSPIGVAAVAILPGTHVHTHNLASTRGRGDLPLADEPGGPVPRLAEPPDEQDGPLRTGETVRRTGEVQ